MGMGFVRSDGTGRGEAGEVGKLFDQRSDEWSEVF